MLMTFDNSFIFEDVYASLAYLQINPNSQTAYIDDTSVKFTINTGSITQDKAINVCQGFPPSCHTEFIVLNDDVNFQFIDDTTNPSPLTGTFSASSISYPSNSGGTTQLTINTQTLPVGTYNFQIKATDEDNNERIVTGNLIKVSTFNPQPNPTQTNQRLVNLEEDVQRIENILENLESCPNTVTKTFLIQGQGPTTLTICTPS